MARKLHKLTARRVDTEKRQGRHGDGGGLYLEVDSSGAKRWTFLYRWRSHPGVPGAGRIRQMGLGSVTKVSLAKARERAAANRALLGEGKDPLAVNRAVAAIPSFGEVAEEMIALRAPELRSEKSLVRWRRSLEYAASLKPIRVDEVATEDVMGVLTPIWTAKPETARKVRGFVEDVLNAAKARGYRSGDNPAAWKGHLDHLLPNVSREPEHHAAMAIEAMPAFMAALRSQGGVGARALEFTILTGARTSQAIGARWEEFDLEERIWLAPWDRMKAGKAVRVPLCERVVEVLKEMELLRAGDFVFPGLKRDRPISTGTMTRVMDRMGVKDATVHGFRSTFRDWAGDYEDVPWDIAEQAIYHSVGNKTQRAYRRGDALDKRRELHAKWEAFCEGRGSSASGVAAA